MKDPDPIFDFTLIAKNKPHLPDAARLGNPGRADLAELLGLYLAMALERHYGADALGWTHLDEESRVVAAFNVPPPPDGAQAQKLRQEVLVPTSYVKALRLKIAELDATVSKPAEPMHPVDIPLHPSMEKMLRDEFAAHEAMEREQRFRAWKGERLTARA